MFLVGAGPGDAKLITLRGMECLAQADLVLYDYLVNPHILRHAPQAECICLGRHGTGRIMPQSSVNQLLVNEATAGRNIVRLKAGDPMIFARAAEELTALEAAGIPYEIVPGITAALAVGSYAGIPITHRDAASAVAFITGRQGDDASTPLDFAQLAAFPGTLVFYMGMTTAEAWTGELMAAGRSADTPAAIVRRCAWSDQLTVRCTLGTLAAEIKQRKLRPPAVIIVGDVVAAAVGGTWFTERPLHGRTVVVTRPGEQAEALAEPLIELGAEVLVQPAIDIGPPRDWAPVDAALDRLADFDWIVFSSANGVHRFLDRLLERGGDLRRLAGCRLAVIGPATAEHLASYHLRSDLAPETYRAEALAEALVPYAAKGEKFLLIRASRGREVLSEQLTTAGGDVTQVVVYQSSDVTEANVEVAEALAAGKVDWMTVSSSAIARSLAKLFGDDLQKTRLVSISPITTATLAELGYRVAAEAKVYTMPGMIEALLAAKQA